MNYRMFPRVALFDVLISGKSSNVKSFPIPRWIGLGDTSLFLWHL